MLQNCYLLTKEENSNIIQLGKVKYKEVSHKMAKNKKISVIVLVQELGENLDRCIHSLLDQSYPDLEIILVGNVEEKLEEYSDKRIVYVEKEDDDLHRILTGLKHAKGDYITILDSRNFVAIDFYRTLIQKAQKNQSDIVVGNVIMSDENEQKTVFNLCQSAFPKELKGKDCLEEFLRQEGLCHDWYFLGNKLYTSDIFRQAMHDLEFFEGCNTFLTDMVISFVLYSYAKRLDKVDIDGVFLHIDKRNEIDFQSPLMNFKQNIMGIRDTFLKMQKFLSIKNVDKKYEPLLMNTECHILTRIKEGVLRANILEEEKQENLEFLNSYLAKEESMDLVNYYYTVKTPWKNDLELIKENICNKEISCVSFDIFDTLVVRPFLEPSDLFKLLNEPFREITHISMGTNFSNIRVSAEKEVRKKIYEETQQVQEITLDQIYEYIGTQYHIEQELLEQVKQKEKEYEISFCYQRKTGYALYELAKSQGKRVICTSDMYLPKETILQILKKNGYEKIDHLYLSAECKDTKATGKLYDMVLKEEKRNPQEVVHIGDNFKTDVENANLKGIKGQFLPKTIHVYWDLSITGDLSKLYFKSLSIWQDNANASTFIGIRCMLAVIANHYFDNPFRVFHLETDFNADPAFIGYYALGTHLFALVKWLLDDVTKNQYEKIVFMARDGYFPLKAYEILSKVYDHAPKSEYLHISRKALFPITIQSDMDFYKLSEVINFRTHTPRKVAGYIQDILDLEEHSLEEICDENHILIDEVFKDERDMNHFLGILKDKLYSRQKHAEKLKILKDYFCKVYSGKACNFDIGYSARPELYLSYLCGKTIDTYFESVSGDFSFEHAKMGGFELKTFYEYKPAVTGTIRETFISASAPSCIGYDCSDGVVKPIFEEYTQNYLEKHILQVIQSNALEFIQDMVNLFGKEIHKLYYLKLDAILPLELYIHSAKDLDKKVLNCLFFEDSVGGLQKDVKLVDIWDKELDRHNQKVDTLLFPQENVIEEIKEEEKPVSRSFFQKMGNYFFKK